jgi:transcription elongation factor Elf1
MGGKKKSMKKVVKKKRMTVPKVFKCLRCYTPNAVTCKLVLEPNNMTGHLTCSTCGAKFSTRINKLTEPIDLFTQWLDHATEAQQIVSAGGEVPVSLPPVHLEDFDGSDVDLDGGPDIEEVDEDYKL